MNTALTMRKGVTLHDPFKSDNGYTLIWPNYSKNMWLIDIKGHIINRWKLPYIPAGHGKLLENGNIFFGGQLKTHKELGLPVEFCALLTMTIYYILHRLKNLFCQIIMQKN